LRADGTPKITIKAKSSKFHLGHLKAANPNLLKISAIKYLDRNYLCNKNNCVENVFNTAHVH
jgi:hypothetical protein